MKIKNKKEVVVNHHNSDCFPLTHLSLVWYGWRRKLDGLLLRPEPDQPLPHLPLPNNSGIIFGSVFPYASMPFCNIVLVLIQFWFLFLFSASPTHYFFNSRCIFFVRVVSWVKLLFYILENLISLCWFAISSFYSSWYWILRMLLTCEWRNSIKLSPVIYFNWMRCWIIFKCNKKRGKWERKIQRHQWVWRWNIVENLQMN